MIKTRTFLRSLLFILIYASFTGLYPIAFEQVGYMYNLTLSFELIRLLQASLILAIYLFLSAYMTLYYCIYIDTIFLGTVLPMLSIFPFFDFDYFNLLLAVLPIVVALVLGMWKSDLIWNTISLWRYPVRSKFATSFMLLFLFLCFALGSLNLSFNIVEVFLSVYFVREVEVPILISYLLGWAPIMVLPAIAYFKAELTNYRLILFLAFVVIFQIILFTTFAMKIQFLYFIYILIIFYWVNFTANKMFLIPFIIPCLVLLSSILFPILQPFTDRFYYLIGINTFYYLEFFSNNPLRFFEGGFFGFGIEVYNKSPGYLIDEKYYGASGTNQSAGAIPTIYSDIGNWGLALLGIIIWLLYTLLYKLKSFHQSYFIMVISLISLMMTNHQINMIFISNGILLILLMSLFARVNKNI